MLLHPTIRRAVAGFFLVELVGSLGAPAASYALMGPGQPEFTAYESPGSTDMVNLSTGDFTYNVPVLEVPGAETTFSLPLTYRAGIRPEQEASWVGLGWSMNPGAIVRNVNGYPDDASGELATNSFSDPGKKGWYGGVPGVLTLGWDSETGRSGSASLLGFVSAGWSGGKLQSGDIIGFGAKRGEGFTVDPVKVGAAALTIATAGIGAGTGSLITGAKVAQQAAGALIVGVGIAAFGKQGPSGGGFQRQTIVKDHTWFRTNYWVFSNDTTKEAMFGSLYFGKMSKAIDQNFTGFGDANQYGPNVYDGPGNYPGKERKGLKFKYKRKFGDKRGNFVTETAADMQQYSDQRTDYRSNVTNPISIAHDDFTVLGAGISGSIRPQRLDVGSLAYPRQMLEHHDKYSLVPWEDDYKVQFRYDNTASNTYTYPDNQNPATSPAGVDASHWNRSELILTDPRLYDPTRTAAAARTEPARKGLTGRQLVQGKHVAWFSNKEIADAYDATPARYPIAEHRPDVAGTKTTRVLVGYQNIPSGNNRPGRVEPIYENQTIKSKNVFRRLRPDSGIGAFAITAEDGTTYHYSLPVYHYRQYSETKQTNGGEGLAINRTGANGTDIPNYATAWLLTAITGPDYVDQGTVGVVDDADYGTWVTFSYGKFSSQFKWRQPYVGTESAPGAPNAATYQEGAKETYYLNAIRTRTHTALFLKSVRRDGRGHYTIGGTTKEKAIGLSKLGIDERTPASSLRLDEVVVLSNPDLAALQTATGFNAQLGKNDPGPGAVAAGYDSFVEVLDQGDVAANSAIRPTLNQKALKRVVFNYSYRLCPETPNSFASAQKPPVPGDDAYTDRGGKLTLESIATYGPNNVKIIPDFRFDYGFNPAYSSTQWDGFGMYASKATAANRRPADDYATASRDGAAWSLTKITNPLGAVTEVAYERDQYASVSEYGNDTYTLTDQGVDNPNGLLVGNNSLDLTNVYKPGDIIHIDGTTEGEYILLRTDIDQEGVVVGGPYEEPFLCPTPFARNYTIISVKPNSIQLDTPPPSSNRSPDCIPISNASSTYQIGGFNRHVSCIARAAIPSNRIGGDIRVARITTHDENNHDYVVKYQYTNSRPELRNSSGVISKEPEFIKQTDHDFYNWFDYPATAVMYGQTTVLRGNFTTPDDIDQREEYQFYTINSDMIRLAKITDQTSALYPFLFKSGYVKLSQQKNTINIDLGLLGQAKSIRRYNRRGTVEFSTVFNYAKNLPNAEGIANQGTFVEGGLTSEFLDVGNEKSTGPVYNLNWTTKQYLPTTLLSTTTTTNNIAATTKNALYDFYTGAVVETALTNSIGDKYRSTQVPAYTVYADLGPLASAASNRHMLSQIAATYSYKDNGAKPATVLGVGIQTWKGDWANYRQYDPATDTYKADPAAQKPIWRQHRTFAWQSPKLNPDGTYADFVAYHFGQPTQAANWLNVGEVTLYDHYSRPLESRDVNGQYTAQKTGFDQSQALAAAGNARYTEIAYSGAEDVVQIGNVTHFGGEVRDGGRRSSAQQHTGQFSSLLTAADPLGFTYNAVVGNAYDLSTDRTYRASVWVHNSDADGSARLYVSLDGNVLKETSRLEPTTKRAGDWYLLTLTVDLPASANGKKLVVGCRRAGASEVYVDDFRFHPFDAPLQASVYDPATRLLTYTLDNDNLFTHYQYDAAGKVMRVSREVLTAAGSSLPAERVVQESAYNYAHLRDPNWIPTDKVRCVTKADGSNTGSQEAEEVDSNTASQTYNQKRWVGTGRSAACPTCTGMQRWVNGKCEEPIRTCTTQNSPSGTGGYVNIYTYTYTDGFYKTIKRSEATGCEPQRPTSK